MTSNEELIAEMRTKGQPATHLGNRLADALEAAQADLAARDAVIAVAVEHIDGNRIPTEYDDDWVHGDEALAILAQSPADALAARDAEKWDEGRTSAGDDIDGRDWVMENRPNPYRTTPTEGATP